MVLTQAMPYSKMQAEKLKEKVIALGIGVGSGYLFETTFKREVYSDLTGERGTLMGAIQGIFRCSI